MAEPGLILVTGAGGGVGGVGGKVVALLRQRGLAVRAMAHHDDDRADALRALGADVVVGDLTRPADVATALDSVQRMFFSMSLAPSYLEAAATVATVARAVGDLGALVAISQMTVSQMNALSMSESHHQRLHWLSEQVLNWSGLPVVHVRPTLFLDNPLFTTLAARSIADSGTIREAMATLDDFLAYQDARDQDLLNVRVRPMIRVGSEQTEDAAIALIDGLGARSGFGDDRLRIWGLKFVMDGGVEGAAMEQPYANDPGNSGHLNWDPAVMTRVCTEAVRRGWRIGTHAVGDRAVRTLLDVYEAVVAKVGLVPPWTLVIEHAMLTDAALRERVVRDGFGVTVQQPLLWNMGSEMLLTWGPERTSQITPIDQWLAAGAALAAGTDIVRPFNPMTNVWGMVTRGTKSAGIQGPEHAISADAALELYTMGTAALNHEQDRLGSITPGKLADLVGYPADPLAADPDDLAELTPAFTMVGGQPTYDPDKRLAR
jgi:hypothetical protein